MSDHGCSPVNTVFHINRWLETEGYLTTEEGVSSYLDALGITKEGVSSIAEIFGVRRLARQFPSSIKNLLPQADEGAKREAKSNMIDWDRSVAVGSGQGPLYIKENGEEPPTTEIASKLESLETPQGNPVVSNVFSREEVYRGRSIADAPELVIEQAPGIHISDGVGLDETFSPPSRWAAENDRNGLFLAVGENFETGHIDRISIKDIAPTILHHMNTAVPRDMEGDVLDVFAGERGSVEYRDPIIIGEGDRGTGGTVEDRLEDLGYIGQ